MTTKQEKKYNHAYAIAFSVETDFKDGEVPEKELISAILKRVADVTECNEWEEAIGKSYDTYEQHVG